MLETLMSTRVGNQSSLDFSSFIFNDRKDLSRIAPASHPVPAEITAKKKIQVSGHLDNLTTSNSSNDSSDFMNPYYNSMMNNPGMYEQQASSAAQPICNEMSYMNNKGKKKVSKASKRQALALNEATTQSMMTAKIMIVNGCSPSTARNSAQAAARSVLSKSPAYKCLGITRSRKLKRHLKIISAISMDHALSQVSNVMALENNSFSCSPESNPLSSVIPHSVMVENPRHMQIDQRLCQSDSQYHMQASQSQMGRWHSTQGRAYPGQNDYNWRHNEQSAMYM